MTNAPDLAKLAHDLRTPLSVIAGYAALLAARNDEPEFVREVAAHLLEATERMSAALDASIPPGSL